MGALDAVFFVEQAATVAVRNGLFHITFAVGKAATVELVMLPSAYLAMRRAAGVVVDRFHEEAGVVAALPKRENAAH
jgi:hypothetical protein